MTTLREFRSNRSDVMCNMFQRDAGESTGPMTLSTLAQRELGAAMRHMDRMLDASDEAEAFGHLLMMLAALRAFRLELA